MENKQVNTLDEVVDKITALIMARQDAQKNFDEIIKNMEELRHNTFIKQTSTSGTIDKLETMTNLFKEMKELY